jgi:hypothetical protein
MIPFAARSAREHPEAVLVRFEKEAADVHRMQHEA